MAAYKYFRWLSLDIVLGAIFFLAYLNDHYFLELQLVVYIELALAVWVIYLLDHLIDTRRRSDFFSYRHQFYKDNFNLLLWLCVLALLTACSLLLLLPTQILINGLGLSLLTLGYLLLVKFVSQFWIKEALIAFGYATGLFLVPYSIIETFELVDYLFYSTVVLIALTNLMLFSIYDLIVDSKDRFPSIVQKIGIRPARTLTLIVLSIASLLAIVLFQTNFNLGLMLGTMCLLLFLLLLFPKRFEKNEWYRVVGDGIFYFPLIFLFIGKL